MIIFLLGFVAGGLSGVIAMALVSMAKAGQADDCHRHAAAERLGVHPDDLVDVSTSEGPRYIAKEGARPQDMWAGHTAADIPVGWTCLLCGHINLTFRRICYGCGALRLGAAPPLDREPSSPVAGTCCCNGRGQKPCEP